MARQRIDPERPGAPAQPETVHTVRHEDWYGRDLSGSTHTLTAFIDLDLTEATGQGAVFDRCTFAGVRFNASRHNGSAFTNCVFTNCTFFDTAFTDCKLVGSLFRRSTFNLFTVSGGDWSFVGLPGADLRKATFRKVRMREADLTGARCDEAVLTDLDLGGAMLHSAKFNRCDLRGSDLSSLDPLTVELSGAKISLEQAAVIAGALGLEVLW
jgi:fluoroquinolone resistance protein